jgi:hypothetical protein
VSQIVGLRGTLVEDKAGTQFIPALPTSTSNFEVTSKSQYGNTTISVQYNKKSPLASCLTLSCANQISPSVLLTQCSVRVFLFHHAPTQFTATHRSRRFTGLMHIQSHIRLIARQMEFRPRTALRSSLPESKCSFRTPVLPAHRSCVMCIDWVR